MACQGCGKASDKSSLCCPTCIELGRTSYFCGQECFTKNWASHDQLHELLRQKKSIAEESAPAAGNTAVASIGSSAGAAGLSGTSGLRQAARAPLAGGTSLVSSTQKRANAYGGSGGASRSPPAGGASAAAAPAGGGLGDLVGWARSAIGGPASGSSRAAASPGGKPAAKAGKGGQPAAEPKAEKPPLARPRRFSFQWGVWLLAAITLMAGGLFLREFSRYADDSRPKEPVPVLVRVEKAAEKVMADIPAAASAVGSLVRPAPRTAADKAAAAAEAGPPPPEPTERPSKQVEALRAEVANLRALVDRHDKMIRYVMDRYVEKALEASTAAESAGARPIAVAHEVSAVNASAPELISRSTKDDDVQKPGDFLRKRKGGGDVMDLPVGLPSLESGGGAA